MRINIRGAQLAPPSVSVFNYLAVRKTNLRLVEIEKMKRKSEIETYRYTNIFDCLKELNSLPDIDYTYLKTDGAGNMVQDKELLKQVVSKASERYSDVKKIYDRIKPLINTNLTDNVSTAISEAERQSNLLVESLYSNTSLPEGIDVVTLMQARQKAEKEIKLVMERQVKELTD